MAQIAKNKISDSRMDREFMSNPDLWPCWPLLPVKRHPKDGTGVECGVMVAVAGHLTAVFMANMIDLGGTYLKASLFDKPEVVRHVYADVDAIQADGWVVD